MITGVVCNSQLLKSTLYFVTNLQPVIFLLLLEYFFIKVFFTFTSLLFKSVLLLFTEVLQKVANQPCLWSTTLNVMSFACG